MSALPQTQTQGVRDAAVMAVVSGLERHGPDAVGIVLKGVPLCLLAAGVHYGLGVPATEAGFGSVGLALGHGAQQWWSGRRVPPTR